MPDAISENTLHLPEGFFESMSDAISENTLHLPDAFSRFDAKNRQLVDVATWTVGDVTPTYSTRRSIEFLA